MYLRLSRGITEDQYDKFYQSFRGEVSAIDMKLANQQEAEDSYYLTSKYILELAKRAYELFKSSELEERRLLIKTTLSNLQINHDLVCYDVLKPFDLLLNFAKCSDWGGLKDVFLNRKMEFEFNLQNIKTVFETFNLQPAYA